ncbi:MAG: SGNH/GDSL hydrolase family protein [Cyclobacteriaceae bacterium]|nr:SGNH/GDSL hydrolase family protein [Cyclobacteriaceae bacterium]
MMKLLVLGDSLSLPRIQPEFCAYEDTWPILLKENFKVHQVSIGGGTITDIVRQVEYHKIFAPDVVILQCGIVDCAPRALSMFELEFIKKLWGIRKILLPIIKKYSSKIRSLRNKTYTAPSEFKKSLARIKETFPTCSILMIGILPPCKEYEKQVPGISLRINQFNALLRDQSVENFISMDRIDRSSIMSDFIHLNPSGQRFIYDKIVALLTTDRC